MISAAIITAAGSGSRMGLNINKILLPFNGSTVIKAAVFAFADSGQFQKIIITHSPSDRERLVEVLDGITVPFELIEGGTTRQDSVFRGLKHLEADNPSIVLIHDAARPWISKELISSVLEQVKKEDSSVPVIPSINAMKRIGEKGIIREHLKREEIFSAQTPQGFNYRKILSAHAKAAEEGYRAVDDTELWDRYCGPVHTVPGDVNNRKITYKEDMKHL